MKTTLFLLLALALALPTANALAQSQRPIIVSDSLLYASLIQTFENGQHQMDQGNLVAAALAFDEVQREAEAGGERGLAQDAAMALDRCHRRAEDVLRPELEKLLADDNDGATRMDLPQFDGCDTFDDEEGKGIQCSATFKDKNYTCTWEIGESYGCMWDN